MAPPLSPRSCGNLLLPIKSCNSAAQQRTAGERNLQAQAAGTVSRVRGGTQSVLHAAGASPYERNKWAEDQEVARLLAGDVPPSPCMQRAHTSRM
jgi:hypothetical protein